MTTAPSNNSSPSFKTEHHTHDVQNSPEPKIEKHAKAIKSLFITSLVLMAITAVTLMTVGFMFGHMALAIPGVILSIVALLPTVAYCKRQITNANKKKSLLINDPAQKKDSSITSTPLPHPIITKDVNPKSSVPVDQNLEQESLESSKKVREIGGFVVPAPAKPRSPFQTNSVIQQTPPLQPFQETSATTLEKILDLKLQKNYSTRWGIEQKTNSSITLRNVHNGVCLTMAKHSNLAIPYCLPEVHEYASYAIVNELDHQAKDKWNTNHQLLKNLTTKKCWKSSLEGVSILKPGEATASYWQSDEHLVSTLMPRGLIQVRLPNFDKKLPEQADQDLLKQTFKNIFRKAEARGCSHLQLAMFSEGNFVSHTTAEKNTWLSSYFTMLQEAIESLSTDSFVRHIILIDPQNIPDLGNYASKYAPTIKTNSTND